MKHIIFTTIFLLNSIFGFCQTVTFQENFEGYQGFGSTLTNGWNTSSGGFKVYIRTFAGGANNKICELPLTNNRRKDSLITPELTLITGSAVLTFDSRIVDSYIGSIASFSHIPVSGDALTAFLSINGGNYSQVENMLPFYPTSSAGLAFTNFSIPINSDAGAVAKVKFVATAKPNTEWYPSFDNFVLTNNSDPTAVSRKRHAEDKIQLIPNPANQRVTIVSPGFSNKAEVEIYNILGTLVFSSSLNSGKCVTDISNFKPGIYLVKVSEGNQSAFERLVVKQ
jgi:hypothetical protein